MNLINIENFTKAYSDTPLFEDISFTLDEHEKVGLIGINGTGKSTLLKIVAGTEVPDSGKVTRANGLTIRFLTQDPQFPKEMTVLQCAMEGNKNAHNEWSLEAEARSMLYDLGVSNFDQPVGELSGGQRKRLALAQTLLSEADVLILDEPTNHLDAGLSEWLENYLKSYRGALLMVTHDRYFLDSVSTRIVELDHGKLYSYETNYSGFLQLKAERAEMAAASERKRQSILRVELEWMMRGARARSTKQKAHIQRYEELAAVKAPKQDQELQLGSVSTRMGRTTVELQNITKSYGDRKLINDFSYIFLKQDRIGFIGENGCGKTTLMKIMDGSVKPDSGEVVIGQTIKIGYYAQEFINDPTAGLAYMDPTIRVIDYIRNTAEYVRTPEGSISASVMLDRFLFPPEKQYALLGKLSGGEKRRLNLLRVLMEAPNVLILDEPTNDLDITTLTILEDYLDSFDGIVITVSHDRYFLDRVVRRIFHFENGTIRQYEGGYTDFLQKKQEEDPDYSPANVLKAAVKAANEAGSVKVTNGAGVSGGAKSGTADGTASSGAGERPRHQEKLKMTFKEQKEFETIDDDIAALEDRIAELEKACVENAMDYMKLNELTKERDELKEKLDEKTERWLYLTELQERIDAQNQ